MFTVEKNIVVVATASGQRAAIEHAIGFGNGTNWGLLRTDTQAVVLPFYCDDVIGAIAAFRNTHPSMIIVQADVRRRDDGIALLNELRNRGIRIPRVLVTVSDPKAFERVEDWTDPTHRFWCVRAGSGTADHVRQVIGELFTKEAIAA